MTTVNVNENIQKAYEIKQGVSKIILSELTEFRAEKTKISQNKNLTADGKQEAMIEIRNKYEKRFLSKMKTLDAERNALLDAAKEQVEKTLTAALPPVDEKTQKLFDTTLKEIEGKVTFAIGAKQAMEQLERLVASATEPQLAQQAMDKFIALSMQAISLADSSGRAGLKLKLGKIYQELGERAQVEGAKGARNAIDTIKAMKGAGYVTGYVQDSLKEISKDAAIYVNMVNDYIEK